MRQQAEDAIRRGRQLRVVIVVRVAAGRIDEGGGCRARPYADHGDWLDADEWCLYTPKGGAKIKVNEIGVDASPGTFDIRWDDDATARFKRIPYFMQAMVKKSVEAKARDRGITTITPEFMEELRKARFGNDKPVFKF